MRDGIDKRIVFLIPANFPHQNIVFSTTPPMMVAISNAPKNRRIPVRQFSTTQPDIERR